MNLSREQPNTSSSLAVTAHDGSLWILFKSGDRDAFASIYQDHIQALYSYGTKICPDNQVVEDCIQELFIYLWLTKENLGHTDHIKYYLFKSLRRRLHLELKAGTKKDKETIGFAAEQPAFEASAEHALIGLHTQENQQESMRQALAALTTRQREAIYLRFYDNLSFQEIAEIMGLQLKSTYNLISKAIEALRENMHEVTLPLLLLISLLA